MVSIFLSGRWNNWTKPLQRSSLQRTYPSLILAVGHHVGTWAACAISFWDQELFLLTAKVNNICNEYQCSICYSNFISLHHNLIRTAVGGKIGLEAWSLLKQFKLSQQDLSPAFTSPIPSLQARQCPFRYISGKVLMTAMAVTPWM